MSIDSKERINPQPESQDSADLPEVNPAEADTLPSQPGSPSLSKPAAEEGRYQVEGEVARGGLGRILRAHDRKLARPVALKELLKQGGKLEERFLREALLTAKLEHPSIVPVHDLDLTKEDKPYYAMKLIDGRSFDKAINEKKTLTERLSLLPHVLDVCEALAYAHSKNIIHRDLKPQNILIGSFGETVVVDWGLAKEIGDRGQGSGIREEESEKHKEELPTPSLHLTPGPRPLAPDLTLAGSILGTPAYMPPEQAQGKVVDERADVYSLGAILYHLLAGGTPYSGRSSREVLLKVLREPPEPLEKRQPQAPKDLLAIVQKAMAREPEQRYPSAKELSQDLKKFQTGQIVGAYQYSTQELLSRWLRRNWVVVSAGVTIILSAFAILFLDREYLKEDFLAAQEQRDKANQQKETAEGLMKTATQEKEEAVKKLDESILEEALLLLDKNPQEALKALANVSKSFPRTGQLRTIAADALARNQALTLPSDEEILTAAFSPDGNLLTLNKSGLLQRWEHVSGQEILGARIKLSGCPEESLGHTFSPDQGSLVFSVLPKEVWLADVKSGACRRLGELGATQIRPLVLSRTGRFLAAIGSEQTIHLWDLHSGEHASLKTQERPWNTAAVFSPDESLLATAGGDSIVRLWDISKGISFTNKVAELEGHIPQGWEIAFSPDGKLLASTDNSETVWLWDLSKGTSSIHGQILTKGMGSPQLISFSPDGKRFGALFDNTMRFWELSSGQAQPSLALPLSKVQNISFSSDGVNLLTSEEGILQLWNLNSGSRRSLLALGATSALVGFSPDNQYVASLSLGKVRLGTLSQSDDLSAIKLWTSPTRVSPHAIPATGDLFAYEDPENKIKLHSFSTGKEQTLPRPNEPVRAISLSRDSEILALSSSQSIELWSTQGASPTLLRTIKVEKEQPRILLSPDARWLVSFSKDWSSLSLWDTESGQQKNLEGHTGGIRDVAFSPDRKHFASASFDGTVRLWDLTAPTPTARVFSLGEGFAISLAFSPDGRWLAFGGLSPKIGLWDLLEDKDESFPNPRVQVNHVTFSPNGEQLALAIGNLVYLRNIEKKDDLHILSAHMGLSYINFSSDGGRLVSVGDDKTTRLWDVETGESRVVVERDASERSVFFSPDSKTLLTVGEDATIRFWKDDLPTEPEALRAKIKELAAP